MPIIEYDVYKQKLTAIGPRLEEALGRERA